MKGTSTRKTVARPDYLRKANPIHSDSQQHMLMMSSIQSRHRQEAELGSANNLSKPSSSLDTAAIISQESFDQSQPVQQKMKQNQETASIFRNIPKHLVLSKNDSNQKDYQQNYQSSAGKIPLKGGNVNQTQKGLKTQFLVQKDGIRKITISDGSYQPNIQSNSIMNNRVTIGENSVEINHQSPPLPQIKMTLRQNKDWRFASPITNIERNKFNHQNTISSINFGQTYNNSQKTAYQYRSDLFQKQQASAMAGAHNVYGQIKPQINAKQSSSTKLRQNLNMNQHQTTRVYRKQIESFPYENSDYQNLENKQMIAQNSQIIFIQNKQIDIDKNKQQQQEKVSNVSSLNLDFERPRNLNTEVCNNSPCNLQQKRDTNKLPSIQKPIKQLEQQRQKQITQTSEESSGNGNTFQKEDPPKSKLNQLEQFIKIIDVQQQRQFLRPNLFEAENRTFQRANFNFQENLYQPHQLAQMQQANMLVRENETQSLLDVIKNNEKHIASSVNNKQILSQRQFMHRGALRVNQNPNEQFGYFRIDGSQFGQTIGTQFRNLSSLRNQSVAQQKQTALQFASFSSGSSPHTALNHRCPVAPELQVTGFSSLKQHMRGNNKVSNDAFTQYAQLQQENKKLEEQISEMRYREFICQSPKRQVDQTAFVIDCQNLRIFHEISKEKLILMRGAKGELVSQQNQSKQLSTETKLTEFQIIEFILDKIWRNRLQDQISQLPQLTPKTSKILNTIQAQAKFQIPSEIPRIDSIVLEIDFEEFKNLQHLKPLFQSFGRRLVNGVFDQSSRVSYKFQTIDEYIEKVKSHHENQVKQGNSGNQTLIDKINSEIQDFDLNHDPQEPQVKQKILSSPFSSKVSKSLSQKMTPKDSVTTVGFLNDSAEFEGLPSMRPRLLDAQPPKLTQDQDHQRFLSQVLPFNPPQSPNMQIINRDSHLFKALAVHDQEQRSQQKFRTQDDSTQFSELYQNQIKSNLSTIVKLPDPSLIKFLVFCRRIGVIKRIEDVLASFFKNVYIVLKPSLLGDVKREDIQEMLLQGGVSEQECFEIENGLEEGSSNIKIQQNQRDKSVSPKRPVSDLETSEGKIHKKSQNKSLIGDVDTEPIEFDWVLPSDQPTSIRIFHEPYKHLESCQTNKFFRIYNKFIQLAFKHKGLEFQKKELDLILKLGHALGVPLPKKPPGHQLYNAGKTSFWVEHFRSAQTGGVIKEHLYRSLNKLLNDQNGLNQLLQDHILFQKPFTLPLSKKERKKQLYQSTLNRQESNLSRIRADQSMAATLYQGGNQAQKEGQSFSPYYKFAVGFGNNHPLIKNILKLRFWYHNSKHVNTQGGQEQNFQMQDPFQISEIIWTQWRRLKVIDQNLDKHQEYQDRNEQVLETLKTGALPLALSNAEAKQEFVTQVNKKLPLIRQKMQKIYNRLEFNQHLNNKKALLFNMKNFYQHCQLPEMKQVDVFDVLPLTFHIKEGLQDPNFGEFKKRYDQEQGLHPLKKNSVKNLWIIKPGENSNRGQRIKVEHSLDKIRQTVESYCTNSSTVIVQKYITNPLLYKNRKFDIRCFGLVTAVNGHIKAYFYKEGYIRTASKEFSLQAGQLHNKFVHLVNDAIQKNCEDYGRYEQANKLSYKEFAKYLAQRYPEKSINFERDILTQVKKIVTDTVRATFHLLDSNRRMNSYELFGYDIMFDEDFKPFLIEVNSNPSLECSSNLLSKFFAELIDGTLRVAVDPLFPPAEGFTQKKGALGIDFCSQTKFELIFDERVDGPFLREMQLKINPSELKEIQDIVESQEENDDQDLDQEIEAEIMDEQEKKLEFVLNQEVSPKGETQFVSFD